MKACTCVRPHGAVQFGRTSAHKIVENDGTGTQGGREDSPQGCATPTPPAPPLPRVQYSDTVAQAANWDEYCTAALPDACTPYYRADLPAPSLDLIFGLQIQVRVVDGLEAVRCIIGLYYRADLPAPSLDLIFGLQIQVRAKNGRHLMMNAPACSPAPATASRAAQCPHPMVAPWLVAHILAFPCGMVAPRRLKEAYLQERLPERIAPQNLPVRLFARPTLLDPVPGPLQQSPHQAGLMRLRACITAGA